MEAGRSLKLQPAGMSAKLQDATCSWWPSNEYEGFDK